MKYIQLTVVFSKPSICEFFIEAFNSVLNKNFTFFSYLVTFYVLNGLSFRFFKTETNFKT